MTQSEAEELCIDIFTEYLPKTITKAVKREVAQEVLRELEDIGALDIEEDPEAKDPEDETEDLTALFDR